MIKHVLLFVILLSVMTVSCNPPKDTDNGLYATLFMVSDNYPKGYKTYMGNLSYTRYILFVFNVKNSTKDSVIFQCSSNIFNDNYPKIRVEKGKRHVDVNCTHYTKRNNIILPNDSIAIAVRLWMSDIDSLGIDLDKESIESVVPQLSFSYILESGKKRNIKDKNNTLCFIRTKHINFHYGKKYIEIKKGIEMMKEIYNESDLNIIRSIPDDL